jgi:hypothetical protein
MKSPCTMISDQVIHARTGSHEKPLRAVLWGCEGELKIAQLVIWHCRRS